MSLPPLSVGTKAVLMIYLSATLALCYFVYTNPEYSLNQARMLYEDVMDRFSSDDPSSERNRVKFHHAIVLEDLNYLKSVCVASKTVDEIAETTSATSDKTYLHYDPKTQKIVCDLEQETKEFTPLMSSYYGKKLAVAQMLLEFGADPNHSNQNHTLLMLAADRNETVWVELFLRYKADPNVPEPESGYSPLMLATYNNHLEVAYFLIKHGANLDYQVPKTGVTALMLAAANGHEKMLKLLLASGADSFLEDKNERTAMEVAKVHGQQNLELVLTSHMSKFVKEEELPNIQFPVSHGAVSNSGEQEREEL